MQDTVTALRLPVYSVGSHNIAELVRSIQLQPLLCMDKSRGPDRSLLNKPCILWRGCVWMRAGGGYWAANLFGVWEQLKLGAHYRSGFCFILSLLLESLQHQPSPIRRKPCLLVGNSKRIIESPTVLCLTVRHFQSVMFPKSPVVCVQHKGGWDTFSDNWVRSQRWMDPWQWAPSEALTDLRSDVSLGNWPCLRDQR